MLRSRPAFTRFAWGLLAYNLAVILWGAFVRATGSGAGCGNHWPLCNGEALPRPEAVETLIELTHRLTSGVDGLLVLLLVVWAFRAFPRRHPVRPAAVGALVFLVSEALLGAGLVRFELVADDDSIERGWVMAAHLVNTFLLLAWLTATAAWATWYRDDRPRRRLPLHLSPGRPAVWVVAGGVAGLLVLGVSGAIAALGDTLFPATTFREGLAQDFSTAAHVFLRLRVWHPVLALAVGLYTAYGATWLRRRATAAPAAGPRAAVGRYATGVLVLFALQILLGVVNVLLAAPVWMQLVHLFAADLVWILWILLGLAALAVDVGGSAQAFDRPPDPTPDATKGTDMDRHAIRPQTTATWKALTLAVLAVALVAVACSRQDKAGQAATASINSGADDYFDVDASTLGEVEVEVRLHDHEIEMAPSLPQGRVTFVVVNDGEEAHGFGLEGRGIAAEVEGELAPGETGSLTVDLEPGTYSVFDPTENGDHGGHGASRWLEVVR